MRSVKSRKHLGIALLVATTIGLLLVMVAYARDLFQPLVEDMGFTVEVFPPSQTSFPEIYVRGKKLKEGESLLGITLLEASPTSLLLRVDGVLWRVHFERGEDE